METSRIAGRSRMKKTTMFVTMVACLMFAMVSVSNAAITLTGAYGDSVYNGTDDPWNPGDLIVGKAGAGSLTIDDGSVVISTWSVISADGGVGEVTITGSGSVWSGIEGLWMAQPGTLNISDSGLFKTDLSAEIFEIDASSEVRMQTGGKMAILNADTTSLTNFLESVTGTGGDANIKYWNGSDWDSMSNGTAGVDYVLTDGAGDLEGYGVLAIVPEPATMLLLALGGLAMLRRRKRA
jgi:T5SS/PEP-CTERM-associated repeat protein